MLILVGLLPKLLTCCSEAPRQVAAVAASAKNVRANMVDRMQDNDEFCWLACCLNGEDDADWGYL
jgi:hypothetical protein